MQHPETPLRRAVGSKGLFELIPNSLPIIPVEERGDVKKPPKNATKTPAKPPADRTALDQAEQAMSALNLARKKEVADLGRRKEQLEQDVATAKKTYEQAKKIAADAVTSASAAYRKAGGKI